MECRRRANRTEFARVEATHAESAARHAGFGQSRKQLKLDEVGQASLLLGGGGLHGMTCKRHNVPMKMLIERRIIRKPRKLDGGVTERAVERARWTCHLCSTERRPRFQEAKRMILSGQMPDRYRIGKNMRAVLPADVLAIYDAEMAKRAEERKETKRKQNRERNYLQKYGLTIQEVEEKAAAQGGICFICRNPFSESRPIAVDHCHASGVVRDLLCRSCNTGIGMLEEDQGRILRAMTYVRRHAHLKTA
jgi:hypothetical protein